MKSNLVFALQLENGLKVNVCIHTATWSVHRMTAHSWTLRWEQIVDQPLLYELYPFTASVSLDSSYKWAYKKHTVSTREINHKYAAQRARLKYSGDQLQVMVY